MEFKANALVRVQSSSSAVATGGQKGLAVNASQTIGRDAHQAAKRFRM